MFYMHHLPAAAGGWLAGLKDTHVGKALSSLQARDGRAPCDVAKKRGWHDVAATTGSVDRRSRRTFGPSEVRPLRWQEPDV